MFFLRPISLKTEVWDRIDTYLNEFATSHPGYMPNRAAFLEEAAIAFLNAREAEVNGGSTEAESSDDTSLGMDMTGDKTSLAEAAEEELVVEEEQKPAKRSSGKKTAKKSAKKSAQKIRRK
jgi:hypothetical protein